MVIDAKITKHICNSGVKKLFEVPNALQIYIKLLLEIRFSFSLTIKTKSKLPNIKMGLIYKS